MTDAELERVKAFLDGKSGPFVISEIIDAAQVEDSAQTRKEIAQLLKRWKFRKQWVRTL